MEVLKKKEAWIDAGRKTYKTFYVEKEKRKQMRKKMV